MNIHLKKSVVSTMTALLVVATPGLPLLPSYLPSAHAAVAPTDYAVRMLLDDNAADSSLNQINATLVGNPTFVPGRLGKAISLKTSGASKQYINLGKPAALQFGTDTSFTVSFWIKSPGNTSDPAVVSNKNWNSGANIGYAIVLKNGTLGWNYTASGSSRLDADIPNVGDGGWHHIAISHDRATGRVDFYKDGAPVTVTKVRGSNFNNIASTMSVQGMTGTIDSGLATMIGNDGTGNYSSALEVALDEVQIVRRAVTAQEVADMYNAAPPIELEPFQGAMNLIGAQHAVQGAQFRYNLDLRTPAMSTRIDKLNVELAYDKDKFEFASATRATYVDTTTPGVLKLQLPGGNVYNQSNPLEYAKSRVTELKFNAKATSGQGTIEVTGAEFYNGTTKLVTQSLDKPKATVEIHSKANEDTNRDGHVTIGDIALGQGKLTDEALKAIAAKVKYQPYKRVVVIGIDGGGASVTPTAPYWETPSSKKEMVGDRLSIPNVRSIIEKGAASYTAQSTVPTSSSPNWGAMLNGVDFSKHQIDNTESGMYTYSETSPYPSVFKKVREALPTTKLIAYSTWHNIISGHIEPSVGVEGTSLGDDKDAAAFAQYAASGKAFDASLIFFQLDDMDGVGHNQGFYTKKYYEQWKQTDANVGTIYNALKANDLLDDSLVVLLPDHGGGEVKADQTLGSATAHGQDTPLAKTIFFAANGRTVATDVGHEKILQGGTTKDLSATILTALGLNPAHGDSKVIDGMFVPQKDQNKPDAPNLLLTQVTDAATKQLKGYELSLGSLKSDVKALDIELATGDTVIQSVEPAQAGVKVLRSESAGGSTRLVLSVAEGVAADKPIVRLKTASAPKGAAVEVKQAMIANALGKETLPNLTRAEKEDVPVTGIELSSRQLTITVGQSAELSAVVAPVNATDKTVVWSSSDPAVAQVEVRGDKALITGLKTGSATVTAKTADGRFQAQSAVSVQPGAWTGPVWPAGGELRALQVSDSGVLLSWPSAASQSGVVTYQVYGPASLQPLATVSGSVYQTRISGLSSDTSYTFTVKAADAAGLVSAPLNKKVTTDRAPGSGSAPSGGSTPTNTDNTGKDKGTAGTGSSTPVSVKLNELNVEVKQTSSSTADGQTVTKLSVDAEPLKTAFSAQKSVVTLDVPGSNTAVSVSLPVGALAQAAKQTPNAVLQIRAAGASYDLPLRLTQSLPENATVTVSITQASAGVKQAAHAAIGSQGADPLLTAPIDFDLRAGDTPISDFRGAYVNRTLYLDREAGRGKQITAVWIDAANQVHFIPSVVTGSGKGATVQIRSPHNSLYTVVQASKTFADVRGHWSQADVELLASKFILQGTSGETFSPDNLVTRAEFAALLVRSLGLADVKPAGTFTDVKPSDWFAAAVQTAYQAGLVTGVADGAFQPNANITREQMVTMIMRALKMAGQDVKADQAVLKRFADQSGIAAWAKDAVAQSVSANLLQGKTESAFAAGDNATRAEAAALLKRMLTFAKFIN